MNENLALPVEGEIDNLERLHRDPPAQYDKTAWAVVERDGQQILTEYAVIECPDCGGRGYWKAGVVACGSCRQRQRLIG